MEVRLVGEEYLGPSSARFRRQDGIFRHKGSPPGRIRLDQPLLGTLQDEPQPVQIVQATAAAQANAEAFPDKLPDHFPVPVGQADARQGGQLRHRCPQLRLLRLAEGVGEPPDCSKIKALGPPSPKAAAHLPMV